MSFPNLPAEYEDPWYTKFINWATSVQNRITGTETVANAAATKAYADGIKTTADAALPVKGDLGTANLNTVIANGLYWQNTPANVTVANNYPVEGASETGFLKSSMRLTSGGGFGIHEWIPQGGSQPARGTFIRRVQAGTFGQWYFMPTQRVDQAAGRAIYTWDNVNNREQLIYSDSGWRNVTASLVNGWTASSIHIKRDGYDLTVVVEGLSGALKTSDSFLAGTPGFVPFSPGGIPRGVLETLLAPADSWRVSYVGGHFSVPDSTVSTPPLHGVLRFKTAQAWPSTLPGTAVGSIPNA